ncbi:MAG: hypothetical protein ACI90V_012264, partial [Bacillariaceae sp.]
VKKKLFFAPAISQVFALMEKHATVPLNSVEEVRIDSFVHYTTIVSCYFYFKHDYKDLPKRHQERCKKSTKKALQYNFTVRT